MGTRVELFTSISTAQRNPIWISLCLPLGKLALRHLNYPIVLFSVFTSHHINRNRWSVLSDHPERPIENIYYSDLERKVFISVGLNLPYDILIFSFVVSYHSSHGHIHLELFEEIVSKQVLTGCVGWLDCEGPTHGLHKEKNLFQEIVPSSELSPLTSRAIISSRGR